MKKSKFSATQIVPIPKYNESGWSVSDLYQEYGISQAIFYKCCSKYGGIDASLIKYLREIEAENNRAKRIYADLSLKHML